MNENYPCKCGHSFECHAVGDGICYPCFDQDRRTWDHVYIPDNLKFLEQKYEQQILNKYRSIKEI